MRVLPAPLKFVLLAHGMLVLCTLQRMEALGLVYTVGTMDMIIEAQQALAAASEACLHGTVETSRTCAAVAAQLVSDLDKRTHIEVKHITTIR